mmetsp:Transcript_106849/g.297478  ORF Transcript_106849/g.297478 Transcript_106849/m.297478 type:complete len:190 (-) Transcript_106849:89-658(-)
MIRGTGDAELELKVIEREGRFIAGLEWHFQDMLQQLESEEHLLVASLAPSQPLPLRFRDLQGCRELPAQAAAAPRGSRSPRTPPLHALLALDPLCAQSLPPLQLDDRHSDEESGRVASPPERQPGAPPSKLPRLEVFPNKTDIPDDSTTGGSSDCDGVTLRATPLSDGKAFGRGRCMGDSSSDSLPASP